MVTPSRADRFRPMELVGLAFVIAAFVGGIVLMSTHEWMPALIFVGGAFVVSLVVLAMLALAAGPIGRETDLRGEDPTRRDEPGGH